MKLNRNSGLINATPFSSYFLGIICYKHSALMRQSIEWSTRRHFCLKFLHSCLTFCCQHCDNRCGNDAFSRVLCCHGSFRLQSVHLLCWHSWSLFSLHLAELWELQHVYQFVPEPVRRSTARWIADDSGCCYEIPTLESSIAVYITGVAMQAKSMMLKNSRSNNGHRFYYHLQHVLHPSTPP